MAAECPSPTRDQTAADRFFAVAAGLDFSDKFKTPDRQFTLTRNALSSKVKGFGLLRSAKEEEAIDRAAEFILAKDMLSAYNVLKQFDLLD